MTLKISRISFNRIAINDTFFHLSPEPLSQNNDTLTGSISRLGLLHPPILKKQNNDTFQIVCGHQRLMAAREVFFNKACDCLLLPKDASTIRALAIVAEEAMMKRPLSLMAQAILFKKVLCHINEQQAAEQFLPLLKITPNPYYIKQLIPLTRLEEPIAIALHRGLLHETVAKELATMTFIDRLSLFETINFLSLSVSNQKKLLTSCQELAKRTQTTVFAIIAWPQVQKILKQRATNTPQKSAALMTLLGKKRFPRLSAAEKDFQNFANSLRLPENINLTHPPFFEKDTITISITFKNKEELQKNWPAIKDACSSKQERGIR